MDPLYRSPDGDGDGSPTESAGAWKKRFGLECLVGDSPAFMKVLSSLPAIAKSEDSVLLRGETGTGKEIIALTIHRLSPRGAKPFVALNCGSLTRELLADQLFGHVKGAYSGADSARSGLVKFAEGGTLFLDEVNSLSLDGQAMLLRLLDSGREYRQIGASELVQANVRILAATNADLIALVSGGTFREDLYYRLQAIEVPLPPLRDRTGDVLQLADHFLKELKQLPTPRLSSTAARLLSVERWTGNVRQLQNVVRSAALRCENSIIQAHDLALLSPEPPPDSMSLKSFRANLAEKSNNAMMKFLIELLRRHKGNKSQAAAAEGFEWHAFRRLLERYKVS